MLLSAMETFSRRCWVVLELFHYFNSIIIAAIITTSACKPPTNIWSLLAIQNLLSWNRSIEQHCDTALEYEAQTMVIHCAEEAGRELVQWYLRRLDR